MIDLDFRLVKRRVNPWMQFALALATGWLCILICKIAGAVSGTEYIGAMIGIILFTIVNTVVSIAQNSFLRYTVPSYYIYGLLVAVLFLSAKFISGISVCQLAEYRMMLFSVTLFYFIVSILVRLVRLIYEIAENDV
jgi:hypothetical protein